MTEMTRNCQRLIIYTAQANQHLIDFAELKDFRTELLLVAAFWKPDLNDGVEITASPLGRLIPHNGWQKRLKAAWENLENGEYHWAHLAYSIWPE